MACGVVQPTQYRSIRTPLISMSDTSHLHKANKSRSLPPRESVVAAPGHQAIRHAPSGRGAIGASVELECRAVSVN